MRELSERPECLSRFEANRLHRADLHGLLGVRIETTSRTARRHGESAKPDKLNFLVAAQSATHRREHGIDRAFRSCIRSFLPELPAHFVDEFGFVHVIRIRGHERFAVTGGGQPLSRRWRHGGREFRR